MKTQQKKISKKTKSERVGKSKAKANKAKIEKLNANLEEYEDIQSLMGQTQEKEDSKKAKALDIKELQKDLSKQKEKHEKDKKVENDILKQLDMINDIGI